MAGAPGADLLRQIAHLATAPEEQATLAARVVERERNVDAVLAAIAVLTAREEPRWRAVLVRRYASCDRDGAHRDPGGTIRAKLLDALAPLALAEDAALFERAASTYEYRFGEVTGDLRGAGLRALAVVDPTLAGFHAVRLLTDLHTSTMSGEPALTAARVLAAQGEALPLYAYVSREAEGIGDVVAEAFRGLTELPATLVPALLQRFGESRDEILLLGLFDLLLARPDRDAYMDFAFDFLRRTPLTTIYRVVVSALNTSRDDALIARLRGLAREERDRTKAAVLREILALRQISDAPVREG